MALSPQALVKGLVSRLAPAFNPDSSNNDVAARQDSYGGLFTQPAIRKSHVLTEEGSYYTANNAQTGLASAYNTAFTATAPFLTLYNNGVRNVAVDYLALVAIAAGASTTLAGYIAAASYLDQGNRYSSGGTQLALLNGNMATGPLAPPNVSVFAGAVVATAASSAVRAQVGVRNLRPSVSATVINVVGDMNLINFGSVEGATGSIVIANANIMPQAFPPVVVPPGYTWLFYLWYPVMSAPSAATFAPELSVWVR